MPSTRTPPAPWPEVLSTLDKSLSGPVELHCLGGFVLVALYDIPRVTGDLDYITVIPPAAWEEIEELAGRESKLAQKFRVFLHRASGVVDLPENYEDRLQELNLGLRNLKLRVLDPYDMVLSKLTRESPKDTEDVKYLASKLKLSFSTLHARFKTEMDWIGRRDWHEATLTNFWREYFTD